MTIENQDPQRPTEDQPAPKQYAGQQPRSGERGTDERTPKTPGRIEDTDADDADEGQSPDPQGAGRAASPAEGSSAGTRDRSTQGELGQLGEDSSGKSGIAATSGGASTQSGNKR